MVILSFPRPTFTLHTQVLHSYGGIVGSEAVHESFGKQARRGNGKSGGVVALLYMTAFVLPKGDSLASARGPTPPFITEKVGRNALKRIGVICAFVAAWHFNPCRLRQFCKFVVVGKYVWPYLSSDASQRLSAVVKCKEMLVKALDNYLVALKQETKAIQAVQKLVIHTPRSIMPCHCIGRCTSSACLWIMSHLRIHKSVLRTPRSPCKPSFLKIALFLTFLAS